MKKKLSIVLLSLVMAFNTCGIVGYANDGITVTLNGDKIDFDVQPQLINDRTMVPLRKIFEAMGAYVDWYGDTQTVVATKDDKVVTAKIDDTKLYINGEVKTLDVPPMIVDGRTLVPARFVAESFGANVDWNGATQTVVIMTKWSEGQPIPYYSKFSSIPDFGLITGVPGTEVNSDNKGAMYEYDIVDVNTNNGMQSYLNVMRNLGFNIKVWDEILTCERDGTYVDISYMDTTYNVVITLPENQTVTVRPTQIGNSYSNFGITYCVPEAWGEPTSKSGNIYFYPTNGMFMIQHQEGVSQQVDEEAVKVMLNAISESVTNYNLISINKINSSNIPNGYSAEYTATISGKDIKAKMSVIQKDTSMVVLSYWDFNASDKVEQLDDVVVSITFDK